MAHLVTIYLLADPVSFNPPVEDSYHGSTLIPIILRHAGNQFAYEMSFFGQYARSLKLFRDIPRQLRGRSEAARFDFDEPFWRLNQATV